MQRLPRLRRGQLIALAAVVVVAIGAGTWLVLSGSGGTAIASPTPSPSVEPSPTPSPSPTPVPTPTPVPAVACPYTGVPVEDEALLAKTALAVQVENNPAARPARNLSNADIVVEAPVEGDTTRFTAIFACQTTEGLTGPIRSARYYNIDLWQDLGALTVGFGASPGSLQRFSAAGMPYVNGITGGWPWFSRFGTHKAPHNLYGDLEALRNTLGNGGKLDALAAKVGPIRPPLTFDPDAVLPTGKAVAAFEIKTNTFWRFGWSWSAATGLWARQDSGVAVTDEVTGEPLAVATVLVQRVKQEVVYGDPDPGGNARRLQHLVGEGDGTLYAAGRAIAVHWSRPTAADGTKWTYADSGQPVVVAPGPIWWEIIPIAAPLTES